MATFILAVVVCVAGASANADTWADRLGYPAGKKVFILYADGAGLAYETNRAAETALAGGQVQSVSLMMPAPWALDFARKASKDKMEKYDIGLALTLTSEYENYRWKPISSGTEVPSLIDADGYLWESPQQVALSASHEDVQREVHAQIDRARTSGFEPSHLSPHLGTLVWRPDLLAIYLEAAHKRWIPAIVVDITPERLKEFRDRGYPINDQIVALIAKYPLPKLDDLQFSPVGKTYEDKRQKLLAMIKSLPPGLTQITFRPATDGDALKQFAPDWQQRVWDAQLLADPEVQRALKQDQIELTNWKEIMRRFDGESKSPAVEP